MESLARAALIRDVAEAIVSYKRVDVVYPYQSRKRQIAAIATDARLHSRGRRLQTALINDVMEACGVSRANARKMICQARKIARAKP